jgi:hypothetical protein
MTKTELYKGIKNVILTTPACPDGVVWGRACESCAANAVAEWLVSEGIVQTWVSTVLDEV